MINVSSEFKEYVKSSREFIVTAEITLANGTILNIDDSMIRTLSIDEAVSKTGTFDIGAAIINKLTIVIDNTYDEFIYYDFAEATIRPVIGLQLSETIESLQKGIYIADEYKISGSVVTITALDRMNLFDTEFKNVEQSFPCTAGELLYTTCLYCSVPLQTTVFTNDDFIIQSRPTDEATTCREIISWIAQIAGCFARINIAGALELKWYDYTAIDFDVYGGRFDNTFSTGDSVYGGSFDDYESGDNIEGGDLETLERFHHIYALGSLSIATDNITITGIQVSDVAEKPNAVLYGDAGYVISIEKNHLIQSGSDAQIIANTIGPRITGMKFRPMSYSAVSDPSREAGDVAKVTDRKGNVYQSLISTVMFSITNNDKLTCEAESQLKKKSVRYDAATKTLIEANKTTDIKITAYDLMVQQLNNLVSYSFGVYKTEEVLPDGSVIYYLHDKPTLAESMKIWKQTADAFAVSTDGGQTYTAGFDVNGNAVVNVLSAIGINADWIRAGKLMSTDGYTLIDLAKGVVNSDNFQETDNIQDGYPLIIKFNIDEEVSEISKVLLKYSQMNFRTSSTTANSGGSSVQTSSNEYRFGNPGSSYVYGFSGYSGTTSSDIAGESYHDHAVIIPQGGLHNHDINIPSHNHEVSIPSHTHELDFGIREQTIQNYAIDIYVNGVLKVSLTNEATNEQGIIDLTQYITAIGWHTIEIKSTYLKRVSAQVNVKSYIRR